MQAHLREVRTLTQPTERPLACAPYTSYRFKGPFGWIMIGAMDDEEAMREAQRSTDNPRWEDLQRWDGTQYMPCSQVPVRLNLMTIIGRRFERCPVSKTQFELMENRVGQRLAFRRTRMPKRQRTLPNGMRSISDNYGEMTGLRPNKIPF